MTTRYSLFGIRYSLRIRSALLLLAAPTILVAQQATTPEARLKALGIELPPAQKAVANYVPAVRSGNLVFLAGQGPLVDGKAVIAGKVGAEVSEEDGYRAARMTILNSLALLRAEIGSLDKVKRIVKLTAWVNSAPGFTRQPFVVNGASDLLVQIFGDAGRHARSAVGVPVLPLDAPVEVEVVFSFA
jgi:enamine deaminase RidA (YjgF/YER057c/UK114 family)